MPIEVSEETGGKIVAIRVRGKLTKEDYGQFVREFERIVKERGQLRVLFEMTELRGWDAGAMWEDIKFDIRHFADIDRLAMVGEKKWQHGMALVFKPFTRATTRYFDHSNSDAARRWLTEPQGFADAPDSGRDGAATGNHPKPE